MNDEIRGLAASGSGVWYCQGSRPICSSASNLRPSLRNWPPLAVAFSSHCVEFLRRGYPRSSLARFETMATEAEGVLMGVGADRHWTAVSFF